MTEYIGSRFSSLASELNDTSIMSSNLSNGNDKVSKFLPNQIDEIRINSRNMRSGIILNDQDVTNENKY